MKRTFHMSGYTLGQSRASSALTLEASAQKKASANVAGEQAPAPRKVEALSPKLAGEIKRRGMRRIAGNVFICNSTRDFWSVADGKIRRLTLTEVENGEQINPAPRNNPQAFIDQALAGITF